MTSAPAVCTNIITNRRNLTEKGIICANFCGLLRNNIEVLKFVCASWSFLSLFPKTYANFAGFVNLSAPNLFDAAYIFNICSMMGSEILDKITQFWCLNFIMQNLRTNFSIWSHMFEGSNTVIGKFAGQWDLAYISPGTGI